MDNPIAHILLELIEIMNGDLGDTEVAHLLEIFNFIFPELRIPGINIKKNVLDCTFSCLCFLKHITKSKK